MHALRHLPTLGIVALCAAFNTAPPLYAQTPPAIHGFNGMMATEGTIKDEHKAANKIVVETKDGVEHVYDAAKGLLVHGGKSGLSDLKPGTTVVIHYTSNASGDLAQEVDRIGADGLSVTEGIVTKINHGEKQITIRYDNGKIEKLRLTASAAVDASHDFKNAPAGTTRIVVYYSDEAGGKIAHYFRRKS